MAQLSYLSATATWFVFVTASRGLSLPLNYPVVQTSDKISLFCYMKTPDGRTLDLRNICGFSTPAVCSDINNKPGVAVLLRDFCKKNQRCQITSTCNEVPQPLQTPNQGEPL